MIKLNLFIVLIAFCGMNDAIAQWNTSGNNIYNTNSGFVGVGNNSPTTLLHVQKNMTEPTITIRNLGGLGGATYSMIDDASGANWKFKATFNGGFKIRDHANELDVIIIEPNSFANAFYVKNSGSIGIGTDAPDFSAILELESTQRGFLPPQLTTTQRDQIDNPAEGLMIYNISRHEMEYFNGVSWVGVSVSPSLADSCGFTIVDDRDNRVYATVKIGDQCWMKENLNFGVKITGGVDQQNNQVIEKWCYNNEEVYCEVYGALYQWGEMMQYSTIAGSQGICPSGWHVPDAPAWDQLINYLGGASVTGGKMKEAGYQHWQSPNIGASNSSGFTALPGGSWDFPLNSGFGFLGQIGYFWSSTLFWEDAAWLPGINYDSEGITGQVFNVEYGFSLRCIRDN